jgi:hypothetical protein
MESNMQGKDEYIEMALASRARARGDFIRGEMEVAMYEMANAQYFATMALLVAMNEPRDNVIPGSLDVVMEDDRP